MIVGPRKDGEAVAKALVVVDSLCNRVPGGACSGRGKRIDSKFQPAPVGISIFPHHPLSIVESR